MTRPCDVTPLMIERYQRHLFHYRKRNGQPLSLTTQSQALAEVRLQLQGNATSPSLFLTKNGRAMHPNYLSALVRKYLENAGVAKAGACHLFRHATATLMLENGADVRFIQALLGHESLRTTQIYTHVSITHLREVHERTHPARLSRLQGSEETDQDGAAAAEGG